jgi:SAM-dependent methyltransferase
MNLRHRENLEKDFKEANSFFHKTIVSGKLLYYFFQRPIANFVLSAYLKRYIQNTPIYSEIDTLLLNDGGMFKNYVYRICNKFYPIKNSSILIPGIGYGKNLFQLAAFRPKIIVAFDLFDYSEEWDFLEKAMFERFKVKVVFCKGDFNTLPLKYKNSFDFIISDAVLEHIGNLQAFIQDAKRFLKDDGIFYASFGPLWYGPEGDHIFWNKERIFDHLVLTEKQYQENFKRRFPVVEADTTEGAFMVKNKLFSYLSIQQYFEILSQAGFQKVLFLAKISTKSIHFLTKKPEIQRLLNQKGVPILDRYCSGIYLWMKLRT